MLIHGAGPTSVCPPSSRGQRGALGWQLQVKKVKGETDEDSCEPWQVAGVGVVRIFRTSAPNGILGT